MVLVHTPRSRAIRRLVVVAVTAALLAAAPTAASGGPVAGHHRPGDTQPDIAVATSDFYVLPGQYFEADLSVQVIPDRGCGVFGGRCSASISWTCLWGDGRLEKLRLADRALQSAGASLTHWVNDVHVRGCADAGTVTPIVTVTARTPQGWASRSAAVLYDDAALDRYVRRLTRLVDDGVAWDELCDALDTRPSVERACAAAAAEGEADARQHAWQLVAAVLAARGTVDDLDALVSSRVSLAGGSGSAPVA